MRLIALSALGLACASLALASGSGRIVQQHGVRLVVPGEWHRVVAAGDAPVTDPRTLLVVGSAGVRPLAAHRCQVAAYRLPRAGAAVVVIGWSRGVLSTPGRAPLKKLVAVRRPSFECFSGRGAAASLTLGGRAYQVNVLVGDGASRSAVARALAVARSFDLAR